MLLETEMHRRDTFRWSRHVTEVRKSVVLGVAVLSNHTTSHSSEVGWAVLQRQPLTKESSTELVREIVGLGFMFDLDQKTQTLRITKVYPRSSAGQAGLSSGLIIQEINDVPTAGKST